MESDDIPPLEDMSEFIMRNKNSLCNNETKIKFCEKNSFQELQKDISIKPDINESSFGGFKKGFLSNINQTKHESDIPLITANKENPLKLKELNIEDTFKKHQDEIVELVGKDKYLNEKILDPKFSEALEDFKIDPKMAMLKHKDNSELMLFMEKFSNILGTHFESLSYSKNKENNEVETFSVNKTTYNHIDKDVQDILNNEELRNLLLDEEIKTFINLMKENPNLAQSLLYSKDANFKMKINKLVQSGLMQFK